MELVAALRLDRRSRVALVGAGGKTSALFCLARQLSPPVLLSTTTHLARHQLALADHHVEIRKAEQIDALRQNLPSGVTLLTGPEEDPMRTAGLDTTAMNHLLELADSLDIPLLIEADGSRQRPLKAPEAHEPAIPEFSNLVIVSAGLAGLESKLDQETVHRPDRFGKLSGIAAGERITQDGLVRVLTHPDGGLKSIPVDARRVVMLTQAENKPRYQAAWSMAPPLLAAYHAVVVADLGELPGIFGEVTVAHGRVNIRCQAVSVHEPIAGVVLAAGGSSRMGGKPKQLLPWLGRPLVRHVAGTALAAGLDPVVVVTGAHAGRVKTALGGLNVQIVHNENWQEGQASSVGRGIKALPPETGAVAFLLVDQPLIPVELISELVSAHSRTLGPIIAPRVGGKRGNPVLFDRSLFERLSQLHGDIGGRSLFGAHPISWISWDDPDVMMDLDTEEDYRRLLEFANLQTGSELEGAK